MAALAKSPSRTGSDRRSIISRVKAGLRNDDERKLGISSNGPPISSHGMPASDYAISASRRRMSESTPDLLGRTMSPTGRRRFWSSKKSIAEQGPTVGLIAPTLKLAFEEEDEPIVPITASSPHSSALNNGEISPTPASPESANGTTSWTRRKSIRRPPSSSAKTAPPPTPAAAVAQAVKSKPATPAMRLDAHRNARLSLHQAKELCALCAKEIRMRGLATVGIFRPFRLAESPEKVDRFIELYLLHSEPATYSHVFSIHSLSSSDELGQGSNLYLETLGKPDALQELNRQLAYANVHDVVALFKWSLRRLLLRLTDFNTSEHYSWYDSFAEAERAAGYPKQAYATLLLPNLPKATADYLSDVFDLASTISAHHVQNACGLSRICKNLAFWLFGRISNDHAPHSLDDLVKVCERASHVMEHLMLAFIRDQSTRIHIMPSRLMELLQSYPHIADGATTPSLPASFAGQEQRALRVDLRSENVVVLPKRPRGPSDTLRAACKASLTDSESSAEVDDWAAIVAYATHAPSPTEIAKTSAGPLAAGLDDSSPSQQHNVPLPPETETDEEADVRREAALLKDEDARILRIASSILANRRQVLDPPPKRIPMPVAPTPKPWDDRSMLRSPVEDRPSNRSSTQLPASNSGSSFSSDFGHMPRSVSEATSLATSQRGTGNLGTLREDDASPSKNNFDLQEKTTWGDFSTSGFDTQGPAASDLALTNVLPPKPTPQERFEELADLGPAPPSARRQPSFTSLRRRGTRSARSGSTESSVGVQCYVPPAVPVFTVKRVTTLTFDEAFVSLWLDQLLDASMAASLPPLLLVQLNAKTASRILATGMGTQTSSWLCIDETIVPPRPPMPGVPNGANANGNPTYAPGGARIYERDSDGQSEKRSLFAPSFRSVSSLFKRPGLRRVASLLTVRGASNVAVPPTSADAVKASAREREKARTTNGASRLSPPGHSPTTNGFPGSTLDADMERRSDAASSRYVDATD